MIHVMAKITLNHICYLSVGELVYCWIKAKLCHEEGLSKSDSKGSL